jgi:hypothetical protein
MKLGSNDYCMKIDEIVKDQIFIIWRSMLTRNLLLIQRFITAFEMTGRDIPAFCETIKIESIEHLVKH